MRLELIVAFPSYFCLISANVLPAGTSEGLNSHAHAEQVQPVKCSLLTKTISECVAKELRLGMATLRL
jgi:hypothetical protein